MNQMQRWSFEETERQIAKERNMARAGLEVDYGMRNLFDQQNVAPQNTVYRQKQ